MLEVRNLKEAQIIKTVFVISIKLSFYRIVKFLV